MELRFQSGSVVRGPLRNAQYGGMEIADVGWSVRGEDGKPPPYNEGLGVTEMVVVSRAPRPLYVNHDRTEPVPGDVVRDADNQNDARTWSRNIDGFSNEWHSNRANHYVPREKLPARLRLLVDGETGQVVP